MLSLAVSAQPGTRPSTAVGFITTLETFFDSTIDKIEIGLQDIGHVLRMLFNNAFYAVQQNKQQFGSAYDQRISISTKEHTNNVEMAGRDKAIGSPQHSIDKIFQPFATIRPTGQRTLVELSLRQDIIKTHGGK